MALSSKSGHLDGEQLMDLVRERLENGQTVRYLPFRGRSMLPMLRQGKDQVELSPLPERLKKYDLPVYRYPSGKYVMHRVIKVTDEHYICNGDGVLEIEQIPHEWMIGLVSAFTRNGRRIEVSRFGYRLYCRFWCFTRPVRHWIRRSINKLIQCLVRFKHRND